MASIVRCWYRLVTGTSRVTVSWTASWKKLAATGVASALDIGFSNWSFEFITISLYTMTKSSCIVFILGFAILFGLEKKVGQYYTTSSLKSNHLTENIPETLISHCRGTNIDGTILVHIPINTVQVGRLRVSLERIIPWWSTM